MDFVRQFKTARKIGTPLVAIRTFDAASAMGLIKTSFQNAEEIPIVLWDCMMGLQPLTAAGKITVNIDFMNGEQVPPNEAVGLPLESTLNMALDASKRNKMNFILFISNAHLEWGEKAAIQGIWNLRDTFKMNGNMLVLLCNPGANLPIELVSDVMIMDEPLPTTEELKKTIIDTFKFASLPEPSAATLNKAVDALIGLPSFPAEQAAAMSLETTGSTKNNNLKGELNVNDLWNRKRQIIGQAPGLSVWEGKERMEDVGGLNEIKLFLKDIFEGHDAPKTIIFIDEIEKAFAGTGTELSGVKTELTGSMLSWMQDTEMDGIIAIGPPGVSKSALAKAVGGTYGVPVIKFDLAGMQSHLVGSSNANLRAAQKTVDAISGGRVLAIATCNSIGALPPELRRRFNMGVFYFDIPQTDQERSEIWAIWRKHYCIPEKQPNPESKGWTGAEIRQCCHLASKLNRTLESAKNSVVPISQSTPDTIEALRRMCSGKYLSASKPGVYRIEDSTEYKAPIAAPVGRLRRED